MRNPRTGWLMLQAELRRRAQIRERDRTARAAHRRLVQHYRAFVSDGDLVFDIGANHGLRTAAFRTLGARVVAVEPQGECVQALRERFASDRSVVVFHGAVGAEPGQQTIYLNASDTLASMATDWIKATGDSGRFGESSEWVGEETVAVTTLDALIAEHGTPSFCKIDVEGYEPQVLAGLTRPLRVVSYELTPETPDKTLACLDTLARLGATQFAVSLRESATLEQWRGHDEIRRYLRDISDDLSAWGDVYARFG